MAVDKHSLGLCRPVWGCRKDSSSRMALQPPYNTMEWYVTNITAHHNIAHNHAGTLPT